MIRRGSENLGSLTLIRRGSENLGSLIDYAEIRFVGMATSTIYIEFSVIMI